MYSKTRLAADQIEGALSLTPRGKKIAYAVVAVAVAAVVAVSVWAASGHDSYATSENGCVSLTTTGTMGGQLFHACGQQARQFCATEWARSDQFARLAQPQCTQAGWSRQAVG